MVALSLAALSLAMQTAAQQAGNMEQEEQPTVRLTECDLNGHCSTRQHKVTLDANWRWIHHQSSYSNCYTGNSWDGQFCSDAESCAQNCVVEGVTASKYSQTYGIEQIDGGDGVKLNFVTEHQYGVNVGSRLYMLDADGENYKMFFLKNREFAMEFDVSHAFCGMNGAMYFVEMDRKGGKGRNYNQAGAKYGTGYCDAQCPHDIKFIDGLANTEGWEPNPKDKSNNMGRGRYGSCCAEMDIWEANSMANAYTPHPCDIDGQLRCDGIQCGDNDKGERYSGVCDKDGCDINPFRMGNQTFYGRGEQFNVNTLKPMTVVTQFLTSDGTDDGALVEMRRFYVQEGKVIHSPPTVILNDKATDSITDQFCADKKALFDDVNDYQIKGGSQNMGESLDRGHVMALSLWDDVEVNMLWLDSAYPLDKPATSPGVRRGDCPGGETSTPSYVRSTYPDGYVKFSNAFVGPIGSFLNQPPTPPPTPAPCVSGCESAPGQNQPECVGKEERVCKEWMSQQNKCNWNVCPVPTPAPPTTPAPMPTPPTPVPTPSPQCQMVPAGIPENTRCQGRPLSGWGGLTQGRKVSVSECSEACLADDSCLFAVWKERTKKCSSFGVCDAPKSQSGFEVFAKDCSTPPTPEPTPPPADCQQFCAKSEVDECASLTEASCDAGFMLRDGAVLPCGWRSCGCQANADALMQCPQLDCSLLLLQEVSKHGSHNEVVLPRHQRKVSSQGFLAPTENVALGSALIMQRMQMCSKFEVLVEEEE